MPPGPPSNIFFIIIGWQPIIAQGHWTYTWESGSLTTEAGTATMQSVCNPIAQSFFFVWWKKAYMPIDANHISNSKDR